MDVKFDFSKKDISQMKEYSQSFVQELVKLFAAGKDVELKELLKNYISHPHHQSLFHLHTNLQI